MSEPVCRVTSLHHPNGVHDVSLTIEAGEVVALIGPSGAGKSTLCRCILGLDTPSAGEVHLLGQPFHQMSERARRPVRRQVQYLPQDATRALDPQQTVLEHLEETLVVLAGRPASDAHELLADLGIAHRAHALPRELSVGEQRRVTLARVLGLRPQFIVADEPTSGLDPERREAVITSLLERRPSGSSCLWVTHETDLVSRHATRVIGLVEGRIVDDVPAGNAAVTHPWVRRAMMGAGEHS